MTTLTLRSRIKLGGKESPPEARRCDCCKADRAGLERSHCATYSDSEHESLGATLQRFEVHNSISDGVAGYLDLCPWCRTWIPNELEAREGRQEAMRRLGARTPT